MMITSLLAAALHKRLRRTGTYTTLHSIAAWQHRRLAVSWYASGMHRHLCWMMSCVCMNSTINRLLLLLLLLLPLCYLWLMHSLRMYLHSTRPSAVSPAMAMPM
jgi:hypothetical protein